MINEVTRKCHYCHTTKPISQFGKYHDGIKDEFITSHTCKPCIKADKEHREEADKLAIRYLKSVGAWPGE